MKKTITASADYDDRFFRHFANMTWPAISDRLDNLEYLLRHSSKDLSKTDKLLAAAVIEAYRQMILDPTKKRQMVVRELRQGPNVGKKHHDNERR